MGISGQSIIEIIESRFPKSIGEEWDNLGLLIGDPKRIINGVLVALDVRLPVVKESHLLGCNMIVTHHPIMMKGIKSIREDMALGKLISEIIRREINLYSCHTNFDIGDNGVNDILASKIGLINVEGLQLISSEKLFKIVVFVPYDNREDIIDALSKAGAGWIGNYSHCTFSIAGTGTFLPNDNANPYIGQKGKLETVEEYRIETIVPQSKLAIAIKSMIKAHPYEEVAYDVYPLEIQGKNYSLGRIGYLPEELTLTDLIKVIKGGIGQSTIVKAVGESDSLIRKVAICGGSGASLISTAAFKGADVLITGDIKYHDAHMAEDLGISLLDIGHWNSEVISLGYLKDIIESQLSEMKKDVPVHLSKINLNPFSYF